MHFRRPLLMAFFFGASFVACHPPTPTGDIPAIKKLVAMDYHQAMNLTDISWNISCWGR